VKPDHLIVAAIVSLAVVLALLVVAALLPGGR
jgi:hypothetical protein